MIRNDAKAVVFENLVNSKRESVIGWLKQKYSRFHYTECEDIFQEASVVVWEKLMSMEDWHGDPMVGMLYRICRNKASHHLDKLPDFVEWGDVSASIEREMQDEQVETEFGSVSSDIYHKMRKEQVYGFIEQLAPKDRNLMELCLQGKKLQEIGKALGFKSTQVAKNRKCKIVERLRKEISGQVTSTCPLFLFHTAILAA